MFQKQIQNLQNSKVQTARSIRLSTIKDQTLQVSETDSEPVEFRSSGYKEYPAIKKKGSNLASFRNCNQPTKFRSLN